MNSTWRFFGDYGPDELTRRGLTLKLYRSTAGQRGIRIVRGGDELGESILALNGSGLEGWADELLRRTVQVDDASAILKATAAKDFVKLFGDSDVGEESSHFQVARAVMEIHHFVALRQSKEILMYDVGEGVYLRNAESIAASLVEKIKGSKNSNGFVGEVLGRISRNDPKQVEDFDADTSRINLKNGILNLTTFVVEPHSPKFLSFAKVNMAFDSEARCPTVISFIDEAHDNAVDKLHDVDFIAACLYNKPIKKSKLDWGDTDSGKTTYQHLVEAAIGPENCCHISPQDLETDRFISYNIVGKLAQLYGDVDKKSMDRSTKFKTTTGGDTIPVQRKHGQPFDYSPRAKGIFAANAIPLTKDESDAFFNRWVPEHWPFVFKVDGKYTKDGAGILVKVGETRKDPYIIDRMATDQELSGLLNVCLRRLPAIVQSKSVPYAPSIEEVRNIWLVNSDFTRLFLFEIVKKSEDGELERQPLYLLYHDWCGKKGITPDSQRTFNNRVEWITGAKKLDTTRNGADIQLWKGLVPKEKNNWKVPPVVPVNDPDQSKLTGGTGASRDNSGVADPELSKNPPVVAGGTGGTGGKSKLFFSPEDEWEEIKAAFGTPAEAS